MPQAERNIGQEILTPAIVRVSLQDANRHKMQIGLDNGAIGAIIGAFLS